jgi:hypothetical protein
MRRFLALLNYTIKYGKGNRFLSSCVMVALQGKTKQKQKHYYVKRKLCNLVKPKFYSLKLIQKATIINPFKDSEHNCTRNYSEMHRLLLRIKYPNKIMHFEALP